MIFTLVLEAATQEAIDRQFIDHLRARGYDVSAPNEAWESPKMFCARVGLRVGHFRRFLDHPCSPKIPTHRGQSGRVIELLSNPAFDAFCRRHKK